MDTHRTVFPNFECVCKFVLLQGGHGNIFELMIHQLRALSSTNLNWQMIFLVSSRLSS